MKNITVLFISLGLYCNIYGQTRIFPNSQFKFRTNDFQFKTKNPYTQFQNDYQASWREKLLDLNSVSTDEFSSNYAFNKISVKKSGNKLNFSGSMPIYFPEGFYNMPVMKPDSSMHYHILVKMVNGHKYPEPIHP
jgi:hypothetical protein